MHIVSKKITERSDNMKVSLNQVSYFYKKNVSVLTDITTSFEFGKTYLLFGRNGAGKSTLASILAGEKKPTKGIIEFPKNINTSNVGYQIQEFNSFPNLKVKEVILFWKSINDISTVDENVLIYALEIESILNKKVKLLSGGEARALSLYLTCLVEKEIIILDEPFAGLDTKKKEIFSEEIKKMAFKNKLVILISHEIKGYEDLFDYITVLREGSIKSVLDTQKLDKNDLFSILKMEVWGNE